MSADKQRLIVLGQIVVMRDRLDALEEALIHVPVGYAYRDDTYNDAAGNLSFQTGILIAELTTYEDMLR